MSLDKLLSNIHEYYELLGFLNAKHPEVLSEWKSKSAVVTSYSSTEPVPEQVT